MRVEIPDDSIDVTKRLASLCGFDSVETYVLELIRREHANRPPDWALSDPSIEKLVADGLENGSTSPLSQDDLDGVRTSC